MPRQMRLRVPLVAIEVRLGLSPVKRSVKIREQSEQGTHVDSQTQTITVLIIANDDDSTIQNINNDVSLHLAARTASAREGTSLATIHQPDIVVMDYDLPSIDGLTTARTILQENPGSMIIVISSSEDPAQIRTAMRAGARDYLIRPLKPDELTDTIHWLISERRDFARMQRFVKKLRKAYETLFFDDQPVPEKVVRMLEAKVEENPNDLLTKETLAVAYARNRQWLKLAPLAVELAEYAYDGDI